MALTAASGTLVAAAGVAVALAGPKTVLRQVSTVSHTGKTAAVFGLTKQHAAPLRVVSMTPGSGSTNVNGTDPVKVVFSAPLASNSPMPKLSPAVAGTWTRNGDAAVFKPATGFFEDTNVTVTVPGGASGVQSAAGASDGSGGRLASSVARHFSTAQFSTLRLQELLAQLGYLPLTWAPSGASVPAGNATAQLAAAYNAPAGTFTWQSGYPTSLGDNWKQGSANLIDTGAVRAFESENNLTMDGIAGPQVWHALLNDVAAGKRNTNGYTYAVASESSPETLTIWHDGHQVLQSLANTGIAAAGGTALGTYPVYERLPYQVMRGTNPNGTPYADPVQYVSYFNGGDAVHYFPRASYGFPQSLGCVELPYGAAKQAYPYLTYGTLVTVTG